MTNEIIDDKQITLDEWFEDYVSGLKEDIRAELNEAEQEQNSLELKSIDGYENLKLVNDAITKLGNTTQRKKTVKKVIDKLGDKGNKDDFAYYSAGMQELLDILYRTIDESRNVPSLPSIRSYKPPKLSIPSAKLVGRIFANDEETQESMKKGKCETPLYEPKRGKPCKHFIRGIQCVYTKDGKDLLSGLSAFDRNVFDGLCSIYQNCIDNGQTDIIVTLGQIYSAFAGREAAHNSTLNKVAASLEKMMSIVIKFNWLEHAQLNGLVGKDISEKKKSQYQVTDNLIHLQGVSYIVNGKVIEQAYKIMAIPVLYKYAKEVGQIVSIRQEVLRIPCVSNTEDNIVIKNYLAYRIELMKNKRNKIKSDKILFDKIFEEAQIEFHNNEKVERKRKRDVICKILNYWIETKYISWYEITKDHGKYNGVQISL